MSALRRPGRPWRSRRLRVLAAALPLFVLLIASAPAHAQESDWPMPVHDDMNFWFVLFDQLELSSGREERELAWDFEGWYGGDYNRLWLKSEGDRPTAGGGGEFEVQALFSRLIAPFWDAQVGVRYDRRSGPGPTSTRAHLALGVQGLAPYWFELEPTVFLSDDGDLTARVIGSYDLLLTQRLVLQPELEANFAAQTNEEWGEGSGLVDLSLGARLRYEIRREFAPYLGVQWTQKYGTSADLARREGEPIADTAFVAGARIWF